VHVMQRLTTTASEECRTENHKTKSNRVRVYATRNAEFAFFATLDIWMVHFLSSGIRLHYFELVVHVHLNYKITRKTA
jgi:hypothetical protein